MIHEYAKNLASNYSNWDYYTFCDRLQLDRGTDTSLGLWEAFQKVQQGLCRFDSDRLAVIFAKDGRMPPK